MPLATIASAVSRTSCSLTSQPNLFQLFHPIGGARARASLGRVAGGGGGARVAAPQHKAHRVIGRRMISPRDGIRNVIRLQRRGDPPFGVERRAGLESILGLKRHGTTFELDPSYWPRGRLSRPED